MENNNERITFDEERRIYSFNLSSFILANIDTEYEIVLDEELKSYFVFPMNPKIWRLIYIFKNEKVYLNDLHKFLGIYKKLKKESIALKDRYLKENN